jgi:hypothetical protein
MTRGRLIFAFLAEIYRLDKAAMLKSDPDGAGPLSSGYDADFKEPVLIDVDDNGVAEPYRREYPAVRVPCQIEPESFEALRLNSSGNAPKTSLELIFHFRDLERLGLVDKTTGDALIQVSDRLAAIYDLDGQLVQTVRTPPGLYVTESRPIGFGLHRSRPQRNLLLTTFQDRSPNRST